MSCPSRLDPAVHLPPGIFHTRHIAGDQSPKNKCCTFPPLNATIPKMAKQRMNSRQKKAEETTDPLSVHCIIPVRPRTDTSIHPPGAVSQSGHPVLTTERHTWSISKISVWKERNRKRRLMRWDSSGISLTPGDASQLRNKHRQVASLRSRLLPVTARDQRQYHGIKLRLPV